MPLKAKNKFKGIRDILEHKNIQLSNLQEGLIKKQVPGNWESYHNVYNLIHGAMPKDSRVFLFLSEYLEENIYTILFRYTCTSNNIISVKTKVEKIDVVKKVHDTENDRNFETEFEDFTPSTLALKLFEISLSKNLNHDNYKLKNEISTIKKIIDNRINKGMVGSTIPEAALFQQIDQINKLLDNGHNVDEIDFGQRTGLMVASLMNNFELVKFFIDKGSSLMLQDQNNLQAIDFTKSRMIKNYLKLKSGQHILFKRIIHNADSNEISNNSKIEKKEEEIISFNFQSIINRSIESLFNDNLLSVRAYNCCRRGKLNDLHSIINYYIKKKSFKHLPNCGLKSETELINLFLNITQLKKLEM